MGRPHRENARGENAQHLLQCFIIVVRKNGKPRKRWLWDVKLYLGRMAIRSWKRKAQEINEWRTTVEETKAPKES